MTLCLPRGSTQIPRGWTCSDPNWSGAAMKFSGPDLPGVARCPYGL